MADSRIPVSHVGSLPQPPELIAELRRREFGEPVDRAAIDAAVERGVADIVRRQVETGIDIVSDGEMGKFSFVGYVKDRLSGFEPFEVPDEGAWKVSKEADDFPDFYGPRSGAPRTKMVCRGPVAYIGHDLVRADLSRLKAAAARNGAPRAFMPAPSPGSVEGFWPRNEHYGAGEDYLYAIADALREEYLAIVEAGLDLQVDDPWIVTNYVVNTDWTKVEARRWAESRVEALNHALRGIPTERVRHHTCYGINMGPRVHDLPMPDIIDIVLKVEAGIYSYEAANARHEHEWRIWQDHRLPDGKAIMPGLITNSSFVVEHPELVADRIERFAALVGRERIVAGADCGFHSSAGNLDDIPPTVVWAKLAALVEGAAIASDRLWS